MEPAPQTAISADPLSIGALLGEADVLAKAMVDTVRECLLLLDGDLRVRLANRSFFLSFEVTPEETMGQLIFELGNGQWDVPELRQLLLEVLPRDNSFRNFEVIHDFPHLGRKVMILNAQRLRGKDGQTAFILLAIEDVTAERERHQKDAYSAAVFRFSGEALIGLSAEGLIQTWNPAAERMYGYMSAEVLGSPISIVVPRERQDELNTIMGRLKKGEAVSIETVRVANGGRRIDVLLQAAPVQDSDGCFIGISAAVIDITERKRLAEERLDSERQLSRMVKEKELLVSEIHHRVKNHLQTVVSLLSLHAGHTDDPRVVEALTEAGGRVRAIVRLHESLYASPNLAEINFGEYLQHLADELRTLHGRSEVKLETDVEDVVVGMETAIPLGLIANELILNSLKHAFPAGRPGCLKAAIGYVRESVTRDTPLDEALVQLRVQDDGVGLPPGLVPAETDTLGLRIVQLLGKQLHGQVEFRSVSGLEVCVTFAPLRV